MDPKQWSAILSRIGPQDADDLDALLGRFDPRGGELGRDIFPAPEDFNSAANRTPGPPEGNSPSSSA